MIELPAIYTPEQLIEIQNYIAANFGSNETDYIAREIESNYIHTDVLIIDNKNDLKVFASMGMGARAMNTPDNDFNNIELMCFASQDLDVSSEETLLIANAIVRTTKFPFSDNTWFGPGHTINVSDDFKEQFGYDYFLFLYSGFTTVISGIGNVNYLILIPLYSEERDWIVKNGSTVFLEKLLANLGYDALIINKSRNKILL